MSDSTPPADSLMPYLGWTEEALRGVVRQAIAHVAAHGLPGEHHFYLTFRTDHAGVTIPAHLKARYPQEMTIVLQHKFWDLKLESGGQAFSVGLSFGGVPAKLVVPFAALTGFADPQVNYGLSFTGAEAAPAVAAPEPAPVERPERTERPERSIDKKVEASEPVVAKAPEPAAPDAAPAPAASTADMSAYAPSGSVYTEQVPRTTVPWTTGYGSGSATDRKSVV